MLSMPKDPEKFKEWLSHQSEKCKRKWSNPERVKRHWDDQIGRAKPKGELSPKWIGDNAKYVTVHLYVKMIKPMPEFCQKCGEQRKETTYKNSGKYKVDRIRPGLELSNMNGVYNRDPDNYMWLCPKCHKAFDKMRHQPV